MDLSGLDRLQPRISRDPLEKQEVSLALESQLENLGEMNQQLTKIRESTALTSRVNDIRYVEKLESIADSLLNAITSNSDLLDQSVQLMLRKGDLRKVKDLTDAVYSILSIREKLLGFDGTRTSNNSKRKLRLQVVWKNDDSGGGGVNIEADEP